ncbi:Ribose/xylose/arabinose/galactoside ABC-type transport systems, periplasmic sugar binding protein [Citrobacter freundii]|uniref:Ribose/xylose/arabinose/galactoside ABC-type transport systems, periplasmic sugar binding protein n=1 Tax=Citrobacter freundii TaxID=546 RepID=A0A7G2IVW9_CITFR|nr:Ribose/xylose/arabinose/galactoside ABC-type transport systems, periplasmic sugar binding protein [Citrobacter freundii]
MNAYQTGPSTPDPAQQVKVIEDLIAKKRQRNHRGTKRCQGS